MTKVSNLLGTVAIVLVLMAAAAPAFALNPLPTVPGCGPTGAPIDGGASLLLAGGAAYAIRRIRKSRRSA